MSQPSFTRSFTATYRKGPYPSISPDRPALSARGKTIIVTGGHTGIGYAIATSFAAAGAANVVILGRRLHVLEDAAGNLRSVHPATTTKVHIFAVSITDEARLHDVFEQIRRDVAEPDVLVTSAVYFAHAAPVLQTPGQQMSASFDTNVRGNLAVVHEFLAGGFGGADNAEAPNQMPERNKTILDVSSAVTHVFLPRTGAYSASKLAFTRLMAIAQRDSSFFSPSSRLRIHSFHPGNVLTQPVRDAGHDENTIPWDDLQLPGQFAVWLASKEAEFLKGRFVWANWDVDELMSRREEIVTKDLLKIGVVGKAEHEVGR